MAGNCAKRALLSGFASRSTSSSSLPSSAAAKLGGFASAKRTSSCLPRHKPSFLSRLPVELGGCSVFDAIAQCYCFCIANFHAVLKAWKLGLAIRRICNNSIAGLMDSLAGVSAHSI